MTQDIATPPAPNKWLNVRVSADEHTRLHNHFKTTTCTTFSEYIRNLLFQRKIVHYTRSKSLDELLAQLILLRKEINAIGRNINQALRLFQSGKSDKERVFWADKITQQLHVFSAKQEELQRTINQYADQWLRE
ncbi:hypothetical protein GA0116948_11048 [Chitinophaga costaii]|uniref:Mobilisation protein (MobC) n=1 Tax=Chitinophaga costaii TaxID=1335309 RepID=A0A1C4EW69_9BACT|nr:hypothetical protein [Chitinophaga costaii]PUZ21611.1 hypothetical protein DCM91_16390 [Chitinophaga costaii]SCC47773.1 hypothetical protein GA0116948_11048 [Chitinophaga costaii]